MPRLVELSHPIFSGMVTVPGLPAPVIDEYLTRDASRERYAQGTTFSIGRITMVANTGTYLDTPFHRHQDGYDLSGLALERVVDLDGLVFDLPTGAVAFSANLFEGLDLHGRAVLLRTGWDRHWGTEKYGSGEHPFLENAGAVALVAAGVGIVGIDGQNIDSTSDPTRPAHTLLLAAGVPIVEHLTGLGQLPFDGFRFTAAPPRVVGMGTWPVRAYAVIE
ncbi:MAG TPA: cyclase family protein [Candidatus Limnocylindrales bacterium]|jgi:kynurenine formamidase